MAKPVFNKTITQSMIDQAAADGLPQFDNLQSVACADHSVGGQSRHWYHLEDGTERIFDGSGNPAEWDL